MGSAPDWGTSLNRGVDYDHHMSSPVPAHSAAPESPPEEARNARERILEAATSFFQQYGYEGTSISRIARAAEMTPANIYWHFPSKLDLLAQVLLSLYQTSYVELAGSVGDGSASERLSNYVKAYVRIQLTELDENCNFGYASLASALEPDARHELVMSGRPYLELLRQILRQGIDEGEFEVSDMTVTSYAISSMCEYVFTWFRAGGRLTDEAVQDHYAVLALSMVRRKDPR